MNRGSRMKKSISSVFLGFVLSIPFVLAQEIFSRGPTETARSSLPPQNLFPLLIIIGVITIFYLVKNKEKITNNQKIAIAVGVLILALVFFKPPTSKLITTEDWQEEYQRTLDANNIDKAFLEETSFIDYSNPKIQDISKSLLSVSENPEEYTQNVLDYVYSNVQYDWHENDQVCFVATASNVLKKGEGQCDTMTLATTAILRAGGIAVQPIGGCISVSPFCQYKMSFYSAIGKPYREPKFTQIIEEDLEKEVFGRGAFGRKGGLHAYGRVYLDNEWIIIDSTSGEIVRQSCWEYTDELIAYKLEDLCVSKDFQFADMCWKK